MASSVCKGLIKAFQCLAVAEQLKIKIIAVPYLRSGYCYSSCKEDVIQRCAKSVSFKNNYICFRYTRVFEMKNLSAPNKCSILIVCKLLIIRLLSHFESKCGMS